MGQPCFAWFSQGRWRQPSLAAVVARQPPNARSASACAAPRRTDCSDCGPRCRRRTPARLARNHACTIEGRCAAGSRARGSGSCGGVPPATVPSLRHESGLLRHVLGRAAGAGPYRHTTFRMESSSFASFLRWRIDPPTQAVSGYARAASQSGASAAPRCRLSTEGREPRSGDSGRALGTRLRVGGCQ